VNTQTKQLRAKLILKRVLVCGAVTGVIAVALILDTTAYVDDIHLPAEPPKLLDDAPVVDITAGRRSEITRHRECYAQFIRW
jgi:hypothetical protein